MHEQVQRQVGAPAPPVDADQAVVAAQRGGRHHRHDEQQHEPDDAAHGLGLPGVSGRRRPRRWPPAWRRAAARVTRRACVATWRTSSLAPRDTARAAVEVAVERRSARRAGRTARCRTGGDSSASRAFSSRSLRFSRRKKACSGATSMASGWSMRRHAHQRRALRPRRARRALPALAPARAVQPATRPARRRRRPRQRLRGRAAGRRVQRRPAAAGRRPGGSPRRAGSSARRCRPRRRPARALEVLRDGAAHALEPRLVVARQALVGLLQRRPPAARRCR